MKGQLRRTTGYADVNGVRVKKYYVALLPLKVLAETDKTPAAAAVNKAEKSGALTSIREILKPPDAATFVRQQEKQLRERRRKVREKIKVHIMEPGADEALQLYACARFSKVRYEDLTADQLQELWYAIDDDENTVGDIYSILLRNKTKSLEVLL